MNGPEEEVATAEYTDLSTTSLRQVRASLSSESVLAACVDRVLADIDRPYPPAAGFNATI